MPEIFARFSSRTAGAIRDASFPASMDPTRDLLVSAKPMRRSTASGGAVHMRRVEMASGLALSAPGVMS